MTIIIDKGTLKLGSLILLGEDSFKIKTILNDQGEFLKEAVPGDAVRIVGIPKVPKAGDQIFEVPNEKKASFILQQKKIKNFAEEK
jgi:translation initiation factor IF-2